MIQQPELGKKIADLRKTKGLTQEELVDMCNLNVRTLQRIESGEVTPRSYTIRLIFEALDFSFEESVNDKRFLKKWLEQFYISFIDLFNLKTNAMKKISILTISTTLIFLGIVTVNTEIQAQKIKKNQEIKTESITPTNNKMILEYFKGEDGFLDNNTYVGKDGELKYNSTKIYYGLISLNTITREFNVGYAQGKFIEQGIEITIEKYNLHGFRYQADTILKSDSTIFLHGNAKLTYGFREDIIETPELRINIK